MRSKFKNVSDFVRGNLRYLFSDHSAIPFSWGGTKGDIAVSEYQSIQILIGTIIFF